MVILYAILWYTNYKILSTVWALYTAQKFQWASAGLVTWIMIAIVYPH